jgi:hypothetical protein
MRRALLIASIALGACAFACADRGVKDHATTAPAAAPEGPAQAPARSGEGPGGEMLLGLALPGLAGDDGRAAAGNTEIPKGREELRAAFDKALAENRVEEAIATADVLAVLFPGDAEILELRGRALVRQGDAEGGRRDLEQCCGLGRATCCGGKAP